MHRRVRLIINGVCMCVCRKKLMKFTKSLAIKKRERQHEDSVMPPFDLPHSPEDQLTVKVQYSTVQCGDS